MRKILLLLLAFVSLTLTLKAQTQSLEDMKLQLEQTDTLYEAEKYDEVLEICLSIGRSTERCDSEQERTVYVRSQILACRCYDQLERYQEGYELSKRLMATQLTDEEKKELSDAYVNSAYFLAVPMMKGKNTDYGKARALLEEVLPYANENDWTIVMNKIGASWYFEGSVYYRKQDYDKTKECARRGVEVFRKTGKVSNEIATLNLLADAYYYQYDLSSAMETYRYALSQAKEAGETDLQMNVLSDIWRLCNLIGDVQMAQGCNVAMDSLAEQTTDEVSKMTYYNLQAEKAMRQENYRVAEQWLFRSVSLAEASTSGKLGSLAGIPYFKLSELYLKAGRYDDCIAYAKKYMEPPHEEMSAVGLYRFMGYGQFMAEAYRYKGDKAGCYEAVDTLFLLLPYLSDPEVINYLYIRRGFCRAAFGDHEAALADYQKADEILATKYKPSDQCRVQLLAFLTRQFHAVGRDAEAEQCSRKNLAYTKELNGENSLQYIESQIRLAQAEEWSGMIVQGCQDYLQAEERLERWVRDRLPYMDANERKGFWSPLSELFTLMTPYALKAGELQTAFTRGCYDALVMSKAFLLDSERSLYDIIKREGTDEDMRQYMAIVAMKQQMKGWEKDYQQNADRILEASKQLEVMGRGLQARVRGYGNNTEFMDVDHEAVRQSLHKDETLIDFTDYETKPSGRHYAAYVVRQEQQYPLLMPLFDECQIDSLCIPQPYLYYDQEYSPAILQLLWTPLASQLHEGQTVYYVPSQLLFNIALECGANLDMVVKYKPELKGFMTTNAAGIQGQGIEMAQAIGAATVDMDQIQIHPTVEANTAALITEGLRGDGAVLINAEGKRFIDEVGTRDVVSAAEIAQTGSYSWLVVDQAMVDASSVIQGYIKKGYTVTGETYEELGKAMGVDEAAFAETMEKWNGYVEAKNDPDFGRTSFANPLNTAPYYAVKVTAGVHHTMGGLKINANTEVLNEKGEVIPGLFAAGEVTGGVHGANRLGGNAVADFTVFGRIAGKAASDYAA